MQRRHVFGVVLAFVAAGCAHYDRQGRAVRTGAARFDAQSVSSPGLAYTLEGDGTWAGIDGDRYELVGDDIRKVGGFGPTPSLVRPSGWVTIDRRPDGFMYLPSYPGGQVWTFVTEDGQPIATELEVPLYLASQLGLGGQWIDVNTPGSEEAGLPLQTDCAVVLFDLQGRQVAGFVASKGAACSAPVYPGKQTLTKMISVRNEIWESPERPFPQ